MIDRPPQVLSDCETYEYEFRRIWDPSRPPALWVMLNPSSITPMPGELPTPADGPTVRRCEHFSQLLGCGGLVTGNVFAFRTKKTRDLVTCADPVGPDNDAILLHLIDEAAVVIAAWGGEFPTRYQDRVDEVRDMLHAKGARCLGKTQAGEPRHPLYVRKDTELVPL